jgi:ABC-type xylose transport system permease subunit
LGNHTGILLSFRDNAATPGDFTGLGTIPAIAIGGTWTGVHTFKVTLKMLGTFVMGLRTTSGGNNHLFEMEWNIVR